MPRAEYDAWVAAHTPAADIAAAKASAAAAKK